MIFDDIYRNKKVLVTGHTGFKGSWLSLWLTTLGAQVYGYALKPPSNPSLYEILQLDQLIAHHEADIRDFESFKDIVRRVQPDIIFHLAAQSLVRESYDVPLETIQVNTLGSVNVMEVVRQAEIPMAVVMVTTDKCYENKEWLHGYREEDPMGGYDPYSASKGAAEILIGSWRKSFFPPAAVDRHRVRLASVRAGNVIGGGDWAKDRIVPDCIRDLMNEGMIGVRNPYATRPWQHVLEPLFGYLQLGARLMENGPGVEKYCSAFNFGPMLTSNRPVEALVDGIIKNWGHGSWKCMSPKVPRHEASLLNLSIDKAFHLLNWTPRWDFDATVHHTVEWYRQWSVSPDRMLDFTIQQVRCYEESVGSSTFHDAVEKEITA